MREKPAGEIIPKTNQVIVCRRPHGTAVDLCEQCACGMLMLEESVAVACVSSREIYRWVEAETVHFRETADGLLLICLNSLLKRMENGANETRNHPASTF